MSSQSFTERYDQRDLDIRTLVGQVGHLGLLCLIAMERMFPEPIRASRLAFMFKAKDPRKTLDPVLADLYTYGYASHTGPQASLAWRITDAGLVVVHLLIASPVASPVALPSATQPTLPIIVDNCLETGDKSAGDFLRRDDLLLDRSIFDLSLDRSKIDLEEKAREPEKIPESTRRAAAEVWCDAHAVTGDKRRAVLAKPLCTAEWLGASLAYWTRKGCTALGAPFRNKWGPLNYAIACCLNGDEPPAVPVVAALPPPFDDPSLPTDDDDGDDESDSLPVFDDSLPLRSNPLRLWQAAQGELQLQMTRATYDTWVKPTSAVKYADGCFTVAVPNQYSKDWWDTRLMTTVARVLTGIVGEPIRAEFVVWKKKAAAGGVR